MKLAFVIPSQSTFIHTDQRILESRYQTHTFCLNQNRGRLRYFLGIVKMVLALLRDRDWKAVLVWFADYHAGPAVAIARLLGRKSIVFIGGYDAVHYPEFGYGVYVIPLRALCARYALRHCDLIIANHAALLKSDNTYYSRSGHPEGVFNLVAKLNTEAIVIHNALSISSEAPIPRQRTILSVGGTPRYQDVSNKGYDLLFRVAPEFPEWIFICVGIKPEWMPQLDQEYQISAITNLVILPHIPHEESIALMQEASIYVQASISEGMPNALMEAMACGCLPVGSNVAGIPTIIAEHGFVIKHRDAAELAAALHQAIASSPDRLEISASTSSRFAFDVRQEKVLQALSRTIEA